MTEAEQIPQYNPFDDPDIQAIVEEIPKVDLAELEESDAVRAFLAQPEVQDAAVYKFGALELRHRRFMTHQLRQIIGKGPKAAAVSDDPMATTESTIYRALSEICMDAPYNTAAFWQVVDTRSKDGRVHKIFKELMEKIGGGEKNIKAFR